MPRDFVGLRRGHVATRRTERALRRQSQRTEGQEVFQISGRLLDRRVIIGATDFALFVKHTRRRFPLGHIICDRQAQQVDPKTFDVYCHCSCCCAASL